MQDPLAKADNDKGFYCVLAFVCRLTRMSQAYARHKARTGGPQHAAITILPRYPETSRPNRPRITDLQICNIQISNIWAADFLPGSCRMT